MKKSKAKYIGPKDTEYEYGEIYTVFPIVEITDGSLIAAENKYGEAYAMPAELFEIVEDNS